MQTTFLVGESKGLFLVTLGKDLKVGKREAGARPLVPPHLFLDAKVSSPQLFPSLKTLPGMKESGGFRDQTQVL